MKIHNPKLLDWTQGDFTGFYGITVKESDGSPSYSKINTINFDSNSFYIGQNIPNTDEVVISFRAAVPIAHQRTYAEMQTLQSFSALSEANITGMTGLNLPNITSVNTKKFRLTARIVITNTSVLSGVYLVNLYNGTAGALSDGGSLLQCVDTLAASGSTTIILGPIEFTPTASNKTKFGLTIFGTQTGNVLAGGGDTVNRATVLCEWIA